MVNILLTGSPGVGKTTIIKKVIEQLDCPKRGFYTQELREEDRRSGFIVVTLDGEKAPLAHVDIESRYMVGRYGVDVAAIDRIAVPAMTPAAPDELIVVDEIGKMECCSGKFRQMVLKVLESPNVVLGTIPVGGTSFIRSLKRDAPPNMDIVQVTRKNRNAVPQALLHKIQQTALL